MVHCLFEQSGTFKNEFLKMGIPAEDYDILDDFGQTDNVCDLFGAIDSAFEGGVSILDNIKKGELVLVFFPCTRFEDQIIMNLRGDGYAMKNWSDSKKLEYSMRLHNELGYFYSLVCKLFLLSIERGWHLIMENPNGAQHYLKRYFPIKAKVFDSDRTRNGDYYIKPTQFWFIGFEPKQNVIFEPLEYIEPRTICTTHNKVERSLIHPQYANRFIRTYLDIEELERIETK